MFSKYYNNLIILTNRNELLPKSNSVNKKDIIKFTTILYLILHVSIIIIFEILFYFLFVIKKEYQVFDYLINDIARHNNIHYDDKTKLIIQKLLKNVTKYINITNLDDINNRAIKDKQDRLSRKNHLFNNSLVIIVCLGSISLLIVNVGIYYKKIKVKCLFFDLLLLLCMIALFEYIFFTKIVSHIEPISVYELLNQIINEVRIKY
jgi:hypothetical protein